MDNNQVFKYKIKEMKREINNIPSRKGSPAIRRLIEESLPLSLGISLSKASSNVIIPF